jgi:hypothetical protein
MFASGFQINFLYSISLAFFQRFNLILQLLNEAKKLLNNRKEREIPLFAQDYYKSCINYTIGNWALQTMRSEQR